MPEDGTPCSYIFKGTDLTSDAKLYVEQFYNFEVIPTEESAPVLRPRNQSFNSSDLDLSKTIVTKVLNATKGDIKDDFAIDSLLNDSIQSLPSFMSNFTNAQRPEREEQQNVYIKKIIPQKPKKQNVFKRAWSSTKSGVSNLGKKVFTKKNAEFAANILGQFMAGYAGAK